MELIYAKSHRFANGILENRYRNIEFDLQSRDEIPKLLMGLQYIVLPKKGRLSVKDKEIEQSEEFVESRRKHSAVESSINALENHGLDRCLDHGLHGFERYVALSYAIH